MTRANAACGGIFSHNPGGCVGGTGPLRSETFKMTQLAWSQFFQKSVNPIEPAPKKNAEKENLPKFQDRTNDTEPFVGHRKSTQLGTPAGCSGAKTSRSITTYSLGQRPQFAYHRCRMPEKNGQSGLQQETFARSADFYLSLFSDSFGCVLPGLDLTIRFPTQRPGPYSKFICGRFELIDRATQLEKPLSSTTTSNCQERLSTFGHAFWVKWVRNGSKAG